MTNTTFKVMDSFQLTLGYVYCLQQRAGRGPENEATPQVATLFYLLYLLVQNNLFVQLCIRGLVRVCFLWSDKGINSLSCSTTVQQLSLAASVMELQRHMVGVGVSPDTSSLRCFTQKEAVVAVEYLSSTLLQHYRLFHLLFTEQQQEELLTTKVRQFPLIILLCVTVACKMFCSTL